MNDLEQQLRRLKFRSPSPELKQRIFVSCEDAKARSFFKDFLRAFAPSREHPYLTSSLACIWLLIALFYFTTPETPKPTGPPVSYAEFRQITLTTKLQIAVLQSEGRLPDYDGPNFSAPRHF
jgi:hypothetical protein